YERGTSMLERVLWSPVFLALACEPLVIPPPCQEVGRVHLPVEPDERNILIKRAVPGGTPGSEISQRILLKAGNYGISGKCEACRKIQEHRVLYGAALPVIADKEEQSVSVEWAAECGTELIEMVG